MITESSLMNLIPGLTIQDRGTIQIFLGSKIREAHLKMLKINSLPNFMLHNKLSLLLKCLHLHFSQLWKTQ